MSTNYNKKNWPKQNGKKVKVKSFKKQLEKKREENDWRNIPERESLNKLIVY